jgi:hypothetical protein
VNIEPPGHAALVGDVEFVLAADWPGETAAANNIHSLRWESSCSFATLERLVDRLDAIEKVAAFGGK